MNYFIQIGYWVSFILIFMGTFLSFFNHNNEGADIASKVILILGIFSGLFSMVYYFKNKREANNQRLRHIENIFRSSINNEDIEPVV